MSHEKSDKKVHKTPFGISEIPTLVSYPQRKGGNKMNVRKDSFKTGINLSGYGQCH